MTNNRRNYYRILQVQPDAPAPVIRASYRAMMKDLGEHPDLGGSNEQAALLNEAYAALSDPRRRAAYDETLFTQYSRGSASQGGAARRPAVSPFCPVCQTPVPQGEDGCPSCGAHLRPATQAAIGRQYRRSVERMETDQRIVYRSESSPGYREARMVDISPRGMRLHCPEKLVRDEALQISGARFEALAVVTNVRAVVAGGRRIYSVGVAFRTVDFEGAKGAFLSTSA